MYISKVEKQIEENTPITEEAIRSDLVNGHDDALYFATETQIHNLIKKELIDEDFSSLHQNYQEEMREMKAEL
jgi:hypothetical protein